MPYTKPKNATLNSVLRGSIQVGKSAPESYVLADTVGTLAGSVTYGDNIPGWRQCVRELSSATTSMQGEAYQWSDGKLTLKQSFQMREHPFTKETHKIEGDVGAGMGIPSTGMLTTDRAENNALASTLSRVIEAQQALSGLTALGELSKTISMIRNPARALFGKLPSYQAAAKKAASMAKTRRTVSRVGKQSPTGVQAAISGTWLEYSFGWVPLINDIKGAAEGLSRISTYTPPLKVVVGKGEEEAYVQSFLSVVSQGTVSLSRRIEDREKASVYYKVCVRTNPSTFGGSLDTFGINLRNLVPTAWELIPYSFLVDYFTNIGTIISSASVNQASIAWVERNSVLSVVRRCTEALPTLIDKGSGWDTTGASFSVGALPRFESRSFSRTAHEGLSVPSFTFKVPGVQSMKWLNIGALLAGNRIPRSS